MAKPTSETLNLSETDRRRLARIMVIHEIAVVLLQWADELGLHEPGAHLTMAMYALQKECPELLDPAAALLRGKAIDAEAEPSGIVRAACG